MVIGTLAIDGLARRRLGGLQLALAGDWAGRS